MHEWTHAERNGFCGGCDHLIAPGDPVRVTTIHGVKKKFIRCAACAGGAPAELPPYVARASEAVSFVPLHDAGRRQG